jgi:histidyl-tRNA synthetase
LARGLDYYTGCIWEVVTAESRAPASTADAQTNGEVKKARAKKEKHVSEDADRSDDPTVGVGSIAAGGRYDKYVQIRFFSKHIMTNYRCRLVGMFSGKGDIPCVGISFGIDRILSVLKKRLEKSPMQLRATEVDVYIMAFGSGLLPERMAMAKELWDAGIKAEFAYKVKPKFDKQFKDAERAGIPFAIILGENELARGEVKLKQMGLPEGDPEKNGIDLPKADVIEELKKRLARLEERSLAARLSAVSLQ